MAHVSIKLKHLRNTSVQIGDDLYFVPVNLLPAANSSWKVNNTDAIYLGPIVDIIRTEFITNLPNNMDVDVGEHELIVDVDPQLTTLPSGQIISNLQLPTISDFLMFGKNNKANMSSLLGYYAELNFRNDTREYAELFSIGSEIQESSS